MDDDKPEHRAFGISGRTLTIDSDQSDLVLEPADVKDVEVTRWFDGWTALGEDPKVTWAMRGDTLKLRMHCVAVVNDCQARHTVKVPRGVAVVVKGDNGDVRASRFGAALKVDADNGDVTVKDARGSVDVRSDNGDVRATLSRVPELLRMETDNGDVDITLPRATYKVDASSDNGDVSVKVPRAESSRHAVFARSDNGDVTLRPVR